MYRCTNVNSYSLHLVLLLFFSHMFYRTSFLLDTFENVKMPTIPKTVRSPTYIWYVGASRQGLLIWFIQHEHFFNLQEQQLVNLKGSNMQKQTKNSLLLGQVHPPVEDPPILRCHQKLQDNHTIKIKPTEWQLVG